MALIPGTKLGPYEIVSPLGAGGMGEVYRARDTRLDRIIAVKVLPELIATDAERLRRFEQEAKAVAALNHPNILTVHDIGVQAGIHFIVTELLVGQTLREKLSGGPLPPRRAADYGLQIAQGLAGAHEKGVTHRDLKPENLFVTQDGRVKILDFGLAKQKQLATHAAADGATLASVDIPVTTPGRHRFCRGVTLERAPARKHLVEHCSKAEDVSSMIYRSQSSLAPTTHLFWRHVQTFHRAQAVRPSAVFLSEVPFSDNLPLR